MEATVPPDHWTYRHLTEEDTDLQQGDIIQPTATLLALLQEHLPHFVQDKYHAFMVLTQTCDLVRRRGKPCTATHINLAAVRQIDDILPDLIDTVARGRIIAGHYLTEDQRKAKELLERIINQNEQKLGIFFLLGDASMGWGDDYVATLRVNFALRREHYSEVLAGRIGGLTPEFQSKLGWLVGNLFDRPATKDFPKPDAEEIVSRYLDLESHQEKDQRFVWHRKRDLRAALRDRGHARVSPQDMSERLPDDKVKEVLAASEVRRPLDEAIGVVLDTVRDLFPNVQDTRIRKLEARLKSEDNFTSLFR